MSNFYGDFLLALIDRTDGRTDRTHFFLLLRVRQTQKIAFAFTIHIARLLEMFFSRAMEEEAVSPEKWALECTQKTGNNVYQMSRDENGGDQVSHADRVPFGHV